MFRRDKEEIKSLDGNKWFRTNGPNNRNPFMEVWAHNNLPYSSTSDKIWYNGNIYRMGIMFQQPD